MPPENTAPVEGAPVVEPTAEPVAEVAAPAPEWDGDFATLGEQEWFKAIPESARTHISAKAEEAKAAAERASFLDKLFESDDAVAALRTELEQSKTERSSLQAALDAATKEKGDLSEKYQTVAQQMAEIEADRAFEVMQAKYQDIFADVYYKDEAKTELEDRGAYMTFVDLLAKGIPEEKAARLARAELPAGQAATAPPAKAAPARPAERPVTLPKAVAAASPGGNSPSATHRVIPKDADIDVAMQMAREKAAVEDGLA
jgi:hypothetical protein